MGSLVVVAFASMYLWMRCPLRGPPISPQPITCPQALQQQRRRQPPGAAPAGAGGGAADTATAAADAALGQVRCLRVADDRALLSALDCLGQRLLAGAAVRACAD